MGVACTSTDANEHAWSSLGVWLTSSLVPRLLSVMLAENKRPWQNSSLAWQMKCISVLSMCAKSLHPLHIMHVMNLPEQSLNTRLVDKYIQRHIILCQDKTHMIWSMHRSSVLWKVKDKTGWQHFLTLKLGISFCVNGWTDTTNYFRPTMYFSILGNHNSLLHWMDITCRQQI